jgi:hypothetical protein
MSSPPGGELMQDDAKRKRMHQPEPAAHEPGRDALRDAIAKEEALLVTLKGQLAETRLAEADRADRSGQEDR